MLDLIGKKVLITTQGWFTAPDGIDYRSVWGELKDIKEAGKHLGFIPNRAHANWFIEVGKMIIMGCQVMYVIECDKPEVGPTKCYSVHEGKLLEYDKPTSIFVSE